MLVPGSVDPVRRGMSAVETATTIHKNRLQLKNADENATPIARYISHSSNVLGVRFVAMSSVSQNEIKPPYIPSMKKNL